MHFSMSLITTFPNKALYSCLITHVGCTRPFAGICINFSRRKALSGPPCKWYRAQTPGSLTARYNLYVFSLQLKSVAPLFWSHFYLTDWYRYLYKPSSGNNSSSGHVSDFSSSIIFNLVASFGFMWVTNYFVFSLFS